MPRYIPIQRNLHQSSGWKAQQEFSFATEMALVPLLVEELSNALPHIAIAFSENKQTRSGYEMVGIQSLQPGKNLLIHPDGRWMGGYIPAFYRSYPFSLLQEEGTDNLHLCIDTDSTLFHEVIEDGDTPLLTEDGSPSEKVKEIINFLQHCHANRNLTQKLLQELKEAELITPWNIEIKQPTADGEAENVPVTGLFTINKKALEELAPATLSALNKSGALPLAYCQIMSEPRLKNLSAFYRLHEKVAKQKAQHAQIQITNLDHIFGESEDEDDVFKF
ncbi:SapC family protein [Oceanospirillum sediminis]|uniref:SapC family protein n=1 Tax=Oceanospirillum sediminis TaxID=2760088 RepID=A0A839IKS6_9GAMM|nr:SapC family protein [Oceanospirillum sediminis]MBB1485310.1 SapC family protein [Oceanospirillum sediminis]